MALEYKLLDRMLTDQQVSIYGCTEIDAWIHAYTCTFIEIISEWHAAIFLNGKIQKFYLWMG